jgi:hypothetical protein
MAKTKIKKPATTTRIQKQTKRKLEAAEEQAATLRAAADQAADSKQPRFAPGRRLLANFFDRVYGWGKDSIFTMPAYSSNSMKRDRWLEMVVKREPYLYGVLQSVVSIDKNRGWNLIGGRNQVNRFVKILHNFEAAPDLTGWRNGMSNAAQSYYGADLGCVVEIGRIIANGPLAALFTVDPSTCRLTGDIDKPLEYTSGRDGDSKQWGPNDYFRVTSMPSTRESMNGLGFCAMSRCIELAQILVGVFDHDKEQLGAKAPKGILTIAGLTQEQWIEALNDAESDQKAQESRFFSNILALASADGTVTANLVPFSSLPSGGFDQQKFVEMIICGYALALGYDPREFWPISSGSLGGTGTEIENQHRRATTKGGLDFALGFQEKLQDELPDTLEFEIEQRDVNGEISEVDLKQKVVTMINDLRTKPNPEEPADITFDEARSMLVEFKIIPEEWTETEEPVNVTDTEDNANANNLERERVQRAMEKFPDEEIVIYSSKTNKFRTLASAADSSKKRSFYMPKVLGKGRGPGRPDSPRAVARDIDVKKKMIPDEKKRQYDGDFTTTQAAYNDAVYTIVRDYLDGSDRATSYKTAFKRNMVEAFASAVENGVLDGGGELPLEGDEDALLTAAQGAELGYIDSLFDELKTKRDAGTVDPENEAQARADGYTATLVGLYNQAVLMAMKNKMVTFVGDDGVNSCETCQWLQGQRHRAKWFIDNGYVPPNGENIVCAPGGHCKHKLEDDDGNQVTV